MEKEKKSYSLSNMSNDELRVLASDIRADILSACLSNGGHLSSNLGIVELTISMLKNIPVEKNDILFDVGHQAYTYKIFTGRDIKKIRTTDGVSPFNLREESPFDRYSNGHAGDCLSTAIGMASAKLLSNDDSLTVAVIGDASIENGISYEALDYLASHKELKNLIIVLNDNGMAISKNKGPISSKFSHLRNSRFYFRTSSKIGKKMSKNKVTWKMFLKMRAVKDHLKGVVLKPTVFESLGIKYIGPYDGHDFDSLDLGFEKAILLSAKQPVIYHVLTNKGYGYLKDDNGSLHGVEKHFDRKNKNKKTSFVSLKEKYLDDYMEKDDKITIITPAMELGSGLENIFNKYPNRCFDVNISEEHAIVMASGLALKGYKPVVDIYSTFLQRGYDEIIENVSRNNVKVTFFVERCGLVGEDGSSHHGIYDVSMIKNIPYRKVFMPFDECSTQYIFSKIENFEKGCVFVRFPKDEPVSSISINIDSDFLFLNKNNNEALVIGISKLGYDLLQKLPSDIDKAILLDLLPDDSLLDFRNICAYKRIYLYDPYSTLDGSASHLSDYLLRKGFKGKYIYYSFGRKFITFGKISDLLIKEGMDINSIYDRIEEEEHAQ